MWLTILFIMALGGLIISISEIIGRRKRSKREAEKDHNIRFRRGLGSEITQKSS